LYHLYKWEEGHPPLRMDLDSIPDWFHS